MARRLKILSSKTIRQRIHVWIYVEQLKDETGKPAGYGNMARSEFYSILPEDRYGQYAIIINSDILNEWGDIGVDQPFLFNAFLHEGVHTRKK